jgi:hypothetical protein
MLAAAIISGVFGAASAGYNAWQGAQARRRAAAAEAAQQAVIDEQKAKYENEAKKDYLDTAEGSAAVTAARETMQNQGNKAANMAAMSGATHEAQTALKRSTQEGFAQSLRGIASNANAYRNALNNRLDNITGQQLGLYNSQINNANAEQAGAQQGVSNAINTMGSAAGLASQYGADRAAKAKKTSDAIDATKQVAVNAGVNSALGALNLNTGGW